MTGLGPTDFVARMRTDQAFRAQVLAAEVGEDRLAYVNGEGYDMTAQQLVDATAELSDEELDDVAGGEIGGLNNGPVVDRLF